MEEKLQAWQMASELVEPIIEKHGLEKYSSGVIFQSTSTFTAVDQHVDHILRVANWLMGKDD